MDELLRDPQFAPQLVKLLNDNLQETRKALEASKKVRAEASLPKRPSSSFKFSRISYRKMKRTK